MAQKWTEEQRTKFKATMKRVHAEKLARREQMAKKSRAKKKLHYKGNGREMRKTDHPSPVDLPVVELSNGHTDAAEFAAAFVTAWKLYKSQ